MKKLLSLSVLSLYSAVALAQLPVSTSTENKNAVLEEFTGIYCTFCPDGHARAQAFSDANPGDVVLINIHAGSYAAPSGSDPDFRTQWGAAIDGQTNLAGYPAGTMNRREFPGMQQNTTGTAMSRGDWAAAGATVIGESSYANMAIEGDIDYASNTLTVDVETYFTGAAPGATVKLNVAVLQSNVEGPQTGMAANPAQVLPNGKYSHNHMLRQLLTGQWGIDIPTTMSSVGTYQYTWVIPTDINGVPVALGDLEIVAFIAEGQQGVVTGVKGPVTFTLPAGVSTADLEAVNSMTVPSGLCETSVTPEFTIQNNESFVVDSVEASMIFNGGTPITQWVTNVAANSTQVVTFPVQTLIGGANTIGFTASVQNVYKYIDVVGNNNSSSSGEILVISQNINAFPVMAGFEALALGATPTDMLLDDETGRVYAVNQSVTNPPIAVQIGGHGQSATSLRFDFATIDPAVVSSLISEKVSLQGGNNSEVQFDYAYGVRGTLLGDKLAAYISTDCGATWVKIWEAIGGSGLETAPATAAGSRFYPTDVTYWNTVSAPIPDADGAAEILVKIEGTSAGSNALYFDNLMIDGKPISLTEVDVINADIYPNPATDVFFIETEETTDITVEVANALGQIVEVAQFSNTNKAEINSAGFAKGVYIVNIITDKGTSSKKITITK